MNKIILITIGLESTTAMGKNFTLTGIYSQGIDAIRESLKGYDVTNSAVIDLTGLDEAGNSFHQFFREIVSGPQVDTSLPSGHIQHLCSQPEPIGEQVPSATDRVSLDIDLARKAQIFGVRIGFLGEGSRIDWFSAEALAQNLPKTALSLPVEPESLALSPVEPWSFDEAIEALEGAWSLKNDLPDGQWEQLNEIVSSYQMAHGKTRAEWPEEAKRALAQEVEANFQYWL